MEEQFSVLIMKQHRTEVAPLQKHQDLGCRAQERFWGHSEGGTLQRVEGVGGATVIHTKGKATVTASYLLHKHHICYLSYLANKSPPHIHTSMRMHTHAHKYTHSSVGAGRGTAE